MKRIKIQKTLVAYVDFETSVLGLIESLNGYIKDLSPEEQASATILKKYTDDSVEYNIVYERLENDKEFERRRKAEEAAKSKETERALFERLERLKKKYG